mmetsp:Transcript_10815/g.32540  ORF Transcript_10815/g.32540 Transcript_10815/m.32540 type:complete len:308 (+) Transcript_10815:234-1157(+)
MRDVRSDVPSRCRRAPLAGQWRRQQRRAHAAGRGARKAAASRQTRLVQQPVSGTADRLHAAAAPFFGSALARQQQLRRAAAAAAEYVRRFARTATLQQQARGRAARVPGQAPAPGTARSARQRAPGLHRGPRRRLPKATGFASREQPLRQPRRPRSLPESPQARALRQRPHRARGSGRRSSDGSPQTRPVPERHPRRHSQRRLRRPPSILAGPHLEPQQTQRATSPRGPPPSPLAPLLHFRRRLLTRQQYSRTTLHQGGRREVDPAVITSSDKGEGREGGSLGSEDVVPEGHEGGLFAASKHVEVGL